RAPDDLGGPISLRGLARSIAGAFGPRAHMVELVRELGQTLVTVLLTNNVAEFGNLWRPMIPVDELFAAVIDSSGVGCRNPDPRIFQLALDAAGSRPEETIFVDDAIENVNAAERLGI